jgi:8-oxo-dGTP pyrophosphatase MutT (NUDIX family)
MRFHQLVQSAGGWATRIREVVFSNPFVEIHQVQMVSPTRPEPFVWTVCHRKAGVCVVPRTAEGRFVMIRQERVPVQGALWEFPAGQIDESSGHCDERVIATGLRELREEAGYELEPGGAVEPLHYFLSSPGFSDEHCYMVLAKGVRRSAEGAHADPGEMILEVREFTSEEVRTMVKSGEIRDANTLCSLARLAALGEW